jgi:replicative DNA helicase
MNRNVNPAEAKKVLKAAGSLPFAMQPCAGWSADAICGHLRRYKWDLAFIDLATRIPAQKTADWDYISGAIADAARQSGTHVILAVQLNRERATSAERPMPVLRDLRNTGAWEQDARNVLFVHRREEIDRDTKVPVLHDDGVIQLAKVSNGQQGVAERVYLNYRRMRFEPLATDDPRRSE